MASMLAPRPTLLRNSRPNPPPAPMPSPLRPLSWPLPMVPGAFRQLQSLRRGLMTTRHSSHPAPRLPNSAAATSWPPHSGIMAHGVAVAAVLHTTLPFTMAELAPLPKQRWPGSVLLETAHRVPPNSPKRPHTAPSLHGTVRYESGWGPRQGRARACTACLSMSSSRRLPGGTLLPCTHSQLRCCRSILGIWL